MKTLTGYMKVFLILLMILFLISCKQIEYVPSEVSSELLEPCPVPKRKRYRNDYLRSYTVELHRALLKCNADKEAIRKELNQ